MSDPSVTRLLAEALEIEPARRDAWLDEACAGRPDVRREVASLLAVEASSAGRLETPAARLDLTDAPTQAPDDDVAPGTRLGRYVVEDAIGSGGMGTVHRARQLEPVERAVAIKLIRPGMDSDAVLARFDLERRTLARLAHPNLAMLLDAGRTERGRPWVVMELVDGVPITAAARAAGLDAAARVDLLLDACAGVRHAHRRGVLHRDLKSSNVLVAEEDGRRTVKVIDFGIAKLLEPDDTDPKVTQGAGGRSPGTPRSMAPEQRTSEPTGRADVRTDVYGLGVLLVDLLAPVDAGADDDESDPAHLASRLPGDLRWVAARCLETDPDDRYPGVDALMADLERWRRGAPTEAGPPGMARRLRVAWRRHRVPVTVTAVVVAALTVGLAAALQARANARAEANRAAVANAYLAALFDRLDPEVARTRDTTLLREMLDDAASRLEPELSGVPAAEAVGRAVIGRAYARIGEGALAAPHLRRAIELAALDDDLDPNELRTWLMTVLKDLGQWAEAIDVALEVHRSELARRGPDDARTLAAANNLATAYMRAERHAEAEPLLRAVLVAKERAVPRDVDTILLSRSNLGTTLSALGRHDEALALREADLREIEARFGADHPRTLTAISNLAVSLDRTEGDPERVLALRERALALALAIHGERHPTTLVTRNNLAMALQDRERHADAVPLFRTGITTMLDMLGPGHAFTVASRRGLAESLVAMGRAADAVPVAEAARAGARDGLPPTHPLRSLTILTHAETLAAAGRRSEAIAVLDAALSESAAAAGDPEPDWHARARALRDGWRAADD